MGTTLHYDLKQIMPTLIKEHRWSVLTAYILHSNANNRAWPSSETIAELATGKNRNRVTRARTWLLEHGALEKVPKAKRFGEQENSLPPRLQVYHLTGTITVEDKTYQYLYSSQMDTIPPDNSIQSDTKDRIQMDTMDGIQSDTQSSSNEVSPKELPTDVGKESSPSSGKPTKNEAIVALITAWVKSRNVPVLGQPYGNRHYRADAGKLHEAGITPDEVTTFMADLQSGDSFWKDRAVKFRYMAEHILHWKASQVADDDIKVPTLTDILGAPKSTTVQEMRDAGVPESEIAEIMKLWGYDYEQAS